MTFGVNNINNESKIIKTQNPMTPSKVLPQPLPHEKQEVVITPKKKFPSSKQPLASTTNTNHENKLATITIVATGIAWYILR
jgi:hypothetical protein